MSQIKTHKKEILKKIFFAKSFKSYDLFLGKKDSTVVFSRDESSIKKLEGSARLETFFEGSARLEARFL